MSQPLTDYLPGFASLLEQIDKRVLVLLRDGRTLFGVLRSIDQFANLVLHLTVERIYIGNHYGEINRGVFLIRGENVVLCGELVSCDEAVLKTMCRNDRIYNADLETIYQNENTSEVHPGYTKLPIEVILANQAEEAKEKSTRDQLKQKALKERGLLLQADCLGDEI